MISWMSGCQPSKSALHSALVPASVQDSLVHSAFLDQPDEVEQRVRPQRIGDHMTTGTDPVRCRPNGAVRDPAVPWAQGLARPSGR